MQGGRVAPARSRGRERTVFAGSTLWVWSTRVLSLLLPCLCLAAIIDRIVVAIGKQVITETELELTIRITAFLNQEPVDFSVENRRKTVERLIEQKIVLQELELSRFPRPTEEEVEQRRRNMVSLRFGEDGAAYQAALQKFGLTEADFKRYLLWQMTFFSFIDFRFRPSVQVTEADIEDYFNTRILPLAQKANPGKTISIGEYRERIERILMARRGEQEMQGWLATPASTPPSSTAMSRSNRRRRPPRLSRNEALAEETVDRRRGVLRLLPAVLAAALVTVQTSWFHDYVRDKMVAAIENATGGKSEIGGYSLDWKTLRAQVNGFVLHGSEPSGALPLFQARSVTATLKIISVFRKKVDLQAVDVIEPRIHLIVHDDGSTNIPSPKVKRKQKDTIETILDLAIKRFSVERGLLILNVEEKTPFDLRGENLRDDTGLSNDWAAISRAMCGWIRSISASETASYTHCGGNQHRY